ncbi:hypothetical protein ASC77_21255 [Nocardioides sp. Root1257]|uniref:DUF4394 domain-containing protein n=1 Tax=unclassified Nocardioides TaxID=2615069 RepID=UPI0006FAA3A2|nr:MULTISPECIES: DUF4394 domain-containing protein [unclassified Nocardioides]KQW43926.1 hypothetical protein ASC77_21255 [Nocardioides sp. Root1257]KRC42367.1 hypothetical protein ASE24_21050 [Nocardioides sp. Root224]
MRSVPLAAAGAVALASLTAVGITTSTAHAAPADMAYALSGSTLLSFDLADPQDIDGTPLTGLTSGETLIGLDVRPQNGELYALGVNATANTGTVYVVHPQTGFAAVVGTAGSVAFTTDGVTAVDLPDPAVVGYGFDVNPAVDRIRVAAGGLTFRANPNDGAPVDGNNGGGATSGTNPDGPISGGTTTIDASAYTNDVANNGGITTLYTLDSSSNSLYIQNPPNAGTQTSATAVTLGGSPLDFSGISGFDIPSGVNASSSNAAVTSGSGYAALTVAGSTSLYSIDLVSGAATLVGAVGNGVFPVQGLAIQRDPDEGLPAIVLDQAGSNLVRFSTATPGTTTTQAIGTGSLVAGETLVAIAWRPQTGQLLALGVNASADTGTLYRLDPQTGGLTSLGSSLVAWAGTDLPNPTVIGYGMDVNPAVDRVRVTAGSGLNGRVNPASGAAVGVVPDSATSQPLTGVSYTNAYGGELTGRPTTLYGVDPDANEIVVVNPPNNGTATLPHPVTLGGSPLDFDALLGFDIPEGVTVDTSNAAATGSAYAVLTVSGTTGLYTIDLATGAATNAGPLLTTARGLAVGTAGADRPVVTPPPPPPAAVPATLTKVGKAKQQKKVVDTGRVLTCPSGFLAASCTSKLKLTATYKVKIKGKTKVRSAVVGAATVKTTKGKATRLKVALSKKGLKLLKQRGRLAAKVAIVASIGPKAASRTTTVKVTLLKKRL